MQFTMRLQQKHVKLCRGYKLLHPRLTKYCRGRVPGVPGGVDAYGGWPPSYGIYRALSDTAIRPFVRPSVCPTAQLP